MMKFLHERQRTPHDCLVCSLAMFLGARYERVVHIAGRICKNTEITWRSDEPMPVSLARLVGIEYRRMIVTIAELPAGIPAMLTLPSPSRPDWLHVVYLSPEGVVFDPLKDAGTDFDINVHKFCEAHVYLRDLAPWVLREATGPMIAAWPEIELRSNREFAA